MAKKYKVVRSFDSVHPKDKNNELQNAFNDGWQFERASEYVPPQNYSGYVETVGYIEYILFKEV